MNFKITTNKLLALAVLVLAGTSCAKKLDIFPENQFTSANVYSTPAGYKSVLAKIYGNMSTTGQVGPNGAADIQGLDEGSQAPFIRGYFNAQELPTDEAIVSWDDQTIKNFHALSVTPADPFLYGLYSRLVYNVAVVNEYLRESTDAKLADRGISGADADAIRQSREEVRFLRAYNYWALMDIFGKSTFITENSTVGSTLPSEISRAALFTYVEGELKDMETKMAPAKSAEYGRVDRAAAWALLARLYLNASVYTGTARNTDAITYALKVINAGYSLTSNYPYLFLADNDKRSEEFIYSIYCDGLHTKSFGNTSFLVHAASGSNAPTEYGVAAGWGGYRTTKQFANLFADLTGNTDKRALFTNLANPEINNVGSFDQGIQVKKWRNIRSDLGPVSDAQNREFVDNDFPVFRLAEMYLIYAEATLRGGTGGNAATALNYVNLLRARAYGGTATGQLTTLALADILPERGRELYWEGHRRTDLVRFGQLTTNSYLWQWKGGTQGGQAVDPKYNLMPIPQTVITANPNLTQNPGY